MGRVSLRFIEGRPGERLVKHVATCLGIVLARTGCRMARLGGWLQGFGCRPLGGWKKS